MSTPSPSVDVENEDWGLFGVYMLSYSVLYVAALLWYVCSVIFSGSWNRHLVFAMITLTTVLAFPVLFLVTITNIMHSRYLVTKVIHGVALATVSLLFLYWLGTSIIMAMATGSWKCFIPSCRRLMVYRSGTTVTHTVSRGVPSVAAVVVMDGVHWLQDGYNTPIGSGHLSHTPETFVIVKAFGVVHYTRFALTALDKKAVDVSHRGIAMYKADRTMRVNDFKQAKLASPGDVALHME